MKAQSSVQQLILARVRGKGRGSVHASVDFLDLGSRAAVDQALSRLGRSGHLRRVARGVYDFPQLHDVLGALPPSLDRVAAAIARSTGSRIQVAGAQAANALGLSTQVPAHLVYLTDGPTRTIRVGSQEIQFRHAAPRRLAGAGTAAGVALQALWHLGRGGVTDEAVDRVRRALAPKDRAGLGRHADDAPAWMRPVLRPVLRRISEAA